MWWPLTGMHEPDGSPVSGELGTPRVDLEGLSFELIASDVEALNQAVADDDSDSPLDLTAISAATYPFVADRWAITACGGSFGEGYGPKVVAPADSPLAAPADLIGKRIAVPGTRTSAFAALTILLAGHTASRPAFEHTAMLFSDVPDAVTSGQADAGLLIHEAQLTYESLGLRKVVDLGEWWTGAHNLPLPLGLNVVRRDVENRFGPGTLAKVGRVLRRSVAYAVEHAEQSREYLLLHAADRPEWHDAALVERYLGMYVSRLSGDMGERGTAALEKFLSETHTAGLTPAIGPIDAV